MHNGLPFNYTTGWFATSVVYWIWNNWLFSMSNSCAFSCACSNLPTFDKQYSWFREATSHDHPLLLLLLLPAAWAPGTCRGQFTLAACFLSMHCVSFWFGIQYLLCIERAIHWWRKCNWQWWQWRWCSHLWLEQVPIYFHQPPVCNRPV